MDNVQIDLNRAMMLDGNAAAGILSEIFTMEMTSCPTQCASCGKQGELGTLLAFMQAPGVVLRCPACENVLIRIVETPDSFYLDARGAVYVRLIRSTV
ncbi:MAG TPA: DUF6510 family protein [Anaerolineales bacterium]|jgi:hypothetical protein